MQRPSPGSINRASETFIKAPTCYSIDADASAALQSSTDRHQQLKMAPIHQSREERAPPLNTRDLFCVSSYTPPPSIQDIAAAAGGLSPHHRSDWFHFVTEQNISLPNPNLIRTSVPTKMLPDVPQNSQDFRRATFQGPHYRMGRETAVKDGVYLTACCWWQLSEQQETS